MNNRNVSYALWQYPSLRVRLPRFNNESQWDIPVSAGIVNDNGIAWNFGTTRPPEQETLGGVRRLYPTCPHALPGVPPRPSSTSTPVASMINALVRSAMRGVSLIRVSCIMVRSSVNNLKPVPGDRRFARYD